jgi:hypothetical protein
MGVRKTDILWILLAVVASVWSGGCSKDEALPKSDNAKADEQYVLPDLAPPALLQEVGEITRAGESVLLRYKPDRAARYQVKLHQSSAQLRSGRRLEMGTEQTFTLAGELEDTEVGRWLMQYRISDLKVTPDKASRDKEMAEAVRAIRDAILKVRFKVRLDGVGVIHEFSAEGGDLSRWAGLEDVLEQLIKDSVVELPDKAVSPGESWLKKRSTDVKKRKTINKIEAELTTTFEGMAVLPGACRRCAVLRTRGEFTITGEVVAPGLEGQTSGRGRSDAVAVLDLDAGRLVRNETGAVNVQKYALAGSLEGKKGTMSFEEEMSTRFVQTWQPPGEGPADKK